MSILETLIYLLAICVSPYIILRTIQAGYWVAFTLRYGIEGARIRFAQTTEY